MSWLPCAGSPRYDPVSAKTMSGRFLAPLKGQSSTASDLIFRSLKLEFHIDRSPIHDRPLGTTGFGTR
jgi:hypothetical protein